jgi:hypothetical protein
MNATDVPLVASIARAGAEDRVFGWLMVAGPAVFALVALLGRAAVTVALASLYVVAFVAYIPYKALTRGER